MIKSSFILLILIVLCVSQRTKFNLTNDMIQPKVTREQYPAKTVNKLIFQNYVESLSKVNFEISSYLYVHEGALYGDQAYNTSNYGGFSSSCRIYRTDLKLRQYREMVFNVKPEATLVVENQNTKIDGVLATIFVAHENKFVSIYQVVTPPQFKQQDLTVEKVDFVVGAQMVGNFTVEADRNQRVNLFSYGNQTYILTNLKMIRYNVTTKQKVEISGFNKISSQEQVGIFRVQDMDDNVFTQRKRFYIQTSRKIYVYQFKTELQIELVVTIDQFSDVNLLTSTYSNGYFYATSFNKLFIINFSDTKSFSVFQAALNGTCDSMEKFSTTLHLSCQYQKLTYIIQFFVLANTVTINRYYASQDIQGRAKTRRLGNGKMAIITDDDIRISSYGINRNILLQSQIPPPQFVFTFKYGIDIVPIKKATSPLSMVMVSFTSQKLAIMQIQQNPPEIYCEYPSDKVGSQYQILMQFNTSFCSFVKREEDLLYGNLENICQMSIPVLVRSKQVQLEQKHTNFIQIILFLLIVGTILLITACALKCHKNFRAQIEKAEKTIEKLKKGYKEEPKKLVQAV